MILIDSDIIIWILRGNRDIKDQMEVIVSDINEKLFITPIQISEIYAGLKEKEGIDTSLFLETLPCLEINDHVGKLAGEYLNIYKKSHGLTLADAMIAACSKIYNLKLWTLNKKHYPMLGKNDFIE
jgi:predicted nucleic acid-binding protein